MVLSTEIARQLVEQLAEVVSQSINIIDTSGIIIASTDKSRIGTSHGGAKRILSENLKDLIIENDDEYEGAKNGINLPVVFEESIVGVIGITGKTDEVAKYGQIIKKMTEILLLEDYVREQKTIEQKARDRFFDEWIFGKFDIKEPQEFNHRARLLGISPEKIKRIAVFGVSGESGKAISDSDLTLISRSSRMLLSEREGSEMFRTSTQFICLFEDICESELSSLMLRIGESLEASYGCRVAIGLDSGATHSHIRELYERAGKAFYVSRSAGRMLTVYDELDLSQFVSYVPEKIMRDYLQKLFSRLPQEETAAWISFLKAYYSCDGSITRLASLLSMHKNTVQYKLGKLKSLTGFDPRSLADASVFTIAIEFFDYLEIRS